MEYNLNQKLFFNKELNELKLKIIESNLICNKELFSKKDVGYFCMDCELDSTSILCQDCFKNSEHVNHKVQFKKNVSGLCDCGDKDAFSPVYYCKNHSGESEIIDNFSDEFRNTIVTKWKNVLFSIIYGFYKNNLNNINEIKELLNFIKTYNLQNIIILKWFSMAFYTNLNDIDDIYKDQRYDVFETINNKLKSNNLIEIDKNDFNLIDIIFNIDLNMINNHVKDFLYSFFNSTDFKNYLGLSYIRNIYIIFEKNHKYLTDTNNYGLNCQLMTSKEIALIVYNSKYIDSFFASIIEFHKKYEYKSLQNYFVTFHNEIHYWLSKKHIILILFENEKHIKYFLDIFINYFQDKISFDYDKQGISYQDLPFNLDNFYSIFYTFEIFESFLILINEIQDINKKNKFIKNIIKILFYKLIINNNKIYGNWEDIKSDELKNTFYILYEYYFSILLNYYFIINSLHKEKKETILNNLTILFDDYDFDTIYHIMNYFFKRIIKFNKNILYLKYNFLGANNHYLISTASLFSDTMDKSNLFLLKIIKLFIKEKKFNKLFFEYFYDVKSDEENAFNNIIIKHNFFAIINFKFRYKKDLYKINIDNIDVYSKSFYKYDCNTKNELYKLIFDKFNDEEKQDFIEFLNKFYKGFFKIFFTMLNKIANSNIMTEMNLFKINKDPKEFNFFKNLLINYFKITKKLKINELSKYMDKIYQISTNNDIFRKNQKNILNQIIKDNLKFDAQEGYVYNDNKNYDIDQAFIISYNNLLLPNLLEIEVKDINKYNIFCLNNYNVPDFNNKTEFINSSLIILNNTILKEFYSSETTEYNKFLIENLNGFTVDLWLFLNENKLSNLNLINKLEILSKEKLFFNMLLNKNNVDINKSKILKKRSEILNNKILKIKNLKFAQSKIPINLKTNNIKVDENNIENKSYHNCIICKKALSNIIVVPFEIVTNDINKFYGIQSDTLSNHISNCKHYFHLECNTNYMNNFDIYNCLYCKKIYSVVLLYNVNNNLDNNKKIYENLLGYINYFNYLNHNMESIFEEFFEIFINSVIYNKKLSDMIIYNIYIIIKNIYDDKIIDKIFNELNNFGNKNIYEFNNEFKFLNDKLKNNDLNYLIRFYDLIIYLKIIYYKSEEKLDKIFLFKNFYTKINEYYLINKIDISFNKYFLKNNLKIKNLLNDEFSIILYGLLESNKTFPKIDVFEKIFNSIKLEFKFDDFYKNLLISKCHYCDNLIQKESFIHCLLCNITFCKDFCSHEIFNLAKDKADIKKINLLLKENNININDVIHNKIHHNNYGIYWDKIKIKPYILYNHLKKVNYSTIYTNDLNEEVRADVINKKDYYLNEDKLKGLINDFLNRKL